MKNKINLGEKIVGMFNDVPLSKEEKKLFVNREKEINKLSNISRFVQKSIYGIAGETGCGKTTLFNMLNFSEQQITTFIITITEKESKEIIIADILYNLCALVITDKKFKNVHPLAEKILRFLREEEIKSKERGVKIGKILEGESKWTKISKKRFNISTIKNNLTEIITAITKENKIVLCIDEIDKESKEDVIVILDSIKDILKAERLSCLIALPPAMYKQYLESRSNLFIEANLENILKDILPINKMRDQEIDEILSRRTKSFPEVLTREVKKVIIKFANGNPREALLLCQNTILSKNIDFNFKKENFILTLNEIKQEMEKFLWTRINGLNLSQREKELLEVIYENDTILKSDLTNSKIPASTRFEIIKKFLDNKIIEELQTDIYKLDGKVQLFYKYIGFQ